MVNTNYERTLSYTLEDVLTEKQLHLIVEKWLKNRGIGATVNWILNRTEMKLATEGLTGFLGDHLRVTLFIKADNILHEILLFIKAMPRMNKPKADFIDQCNFYRREMIMYKLFEEIDGQTDAHGSEPWHPEAYICDENIVVMPDLTEEGYSQHPFLLTMDLDHILVTIASLARFHAAIANFETNKSIENPYTIIQEYGEILAECNFKDSPWLRAAAKLTSNFIEEFSMKLKGIKGLESKLLKLYVAACDSVKDYEETFNTVIHKDLWSNNILFCYNGTKPRGAVLIDFQCLRYAPPAFDVMITLFLNTNAEFRKKYEQVIFSHYFTVFEESISENTLKRLLKLGYNFSEFCRWCEKARMFGMLETIGIFPYTLMDPVSAQKTFDDEKTYDEYTNVDRTKPVIEHAYESPTYKERILEVSEEFIERYLNLNMQ